MRQPRILKTLNPREGFSAEDFGYTIEEVRENFPRADEYREERSYFPNDTPDSIRFTWHPVIWDIENEIAFVCTDEEHEQEMTVRIRKRIEHRRELPYKAHFTAEHDLTINSNGFIYYEGYNIGVLTGLE